MEDRILSAPPTVAHDSRVAPISDLQARQAREAETFRERGWLNLIEVGQRTRGAIHPCVPGDEVQ